MFLTIDQGTTSTRCIIFDKNANVQGSVQQEIKQFFPQEAWVEHDPENIWETTLITMQQAIADANINPKQINGIGISNQRETTILWNKKTGKAIYPAIVWQDRRTYHYCEQLIRNGLTDMIHQKTGLIIDPYFSASKINWILENVSEAKNLLKENNLLFGTVETYLIWRLTGGKRHVTDMTNASRTMLFNIVDQTWDAALLDLFNIPEQILPEVLENVSFFGETAYALFNCHIPILGSAGDQQAAAIGQCCFSRGMLKTTYGTGCFALLNLGDVPAYSKHRLLTTIAYSIAGKTTFGLEGSIFVAGAAVQWLRDAMSLISHAKESEKLALALQENDNVYLVPAFTGLGAPYWDPLARGAIFGLTRNTGVKHIVRAALESVCYQTRDLLHAMQEDGLDINVLRVDGRMVENNWLMQFLADIIQLEIKRPNNIETSALGVFFLAALGSGAYSSINDIAQLWQLEKSFLPSMSTKKSNQLYDGWLNAVKRVL
ncbi:MAG: glycerol kinase [Legionellales bacterium]|nr:glycerol kinase [Legionellales bacterium]